MRPIVLYGDCQRFLRTDYDGKFSGPGYCSIEQVALEHHEMLGKQGEDHRWIFASLRLVNRYGVSVNEFFEFGKIVFRAPTVEFDPDFCALPGLSCGFGRCLR